MKKELDPEHMKAAIAKFLSNLEASNANFKDTIPEPLGTTRHKSLNSGSYRVEEGSTDKDVNYHMGTWA